MNISGLFKKKNQPQSHYIGIYFKDSSLEAFLYELNGASMTVANHETHPYTNGWDTLTEDTDDLLFAIEQESKKKFEQAILFVHGYVVDPATKQVREPYKSAIKRMLKNLGLKPMGYIECYEAVVSHLEKTDHTLTNAILVEMDGSHLAAYLYLGGRQMYRHSFDKHTSLIHHLEAEFTRMKQDAMLPSRLILFGDHNYQKEVDEFLGHDFESKLFTHLPKVEVVSEEILTRALNQTFKDQMLHQDGPVIDTTGEDESQVRAMPEPNFVEVEPKQPVGHEEKKEVMGFVIGDEIGESEAKEEAGPKEAAPASPKRERKPGPALSDRMGGLMQTFGALLVKVRNLLPAKKGGAFYLVALGLFLILAGIFCLEYFFHKAQLTIYFPSQTINKSMTVPAILGDNEINLKVGTLSAQVSTKKTTTGKRDVGDKAKGQVTINNFSDASKTFAKGTALKYDNYSFVLDQDVNVASASEVIITGSNYVKQPGTAKGNVVAADIGTESNLDKGKKFQIADLSLSTYFAINEAAFSGGTKKQVSTVAKSDVDDLKKQALTQGNKQAEQDLKKVQTSRDEQVLGPLTETSPKTLDFSKEIGEEATEVKLDADVGVTYYTFSASQMRSYLKEQLNPAVQSGFALLPEKITYSVSSAKISDEEVKIGLKVQAKAMRKFSRDEILKKVTGRSRQDIESILKNDFKASAFDLKTLQSPVFFLSGRLPFADRNIDIKIDSL